MSPWKSLFLSCFLLLTACAAQAQRNRQQQSVAGKRRLDLRFREIITFDFSLVADHAISPVVVQYECDFRINLVSPAPLFAFFTLSRPACTTITKELTPSFSVHT